MIVISKIVLLSSLLSILNSNPASCISNEVRNSIDACADWYKHLDIEFGSFAVRNITLKIDRLDICSCASACLLRSYAGECDAFYMQDHACFLTQREHTGIDDIDLTFMHILINRTLENHVQGTLPLLHCIKKGRRFKMAAVMFNSEENKTDCPKLTTVEEESQTILSSSLDLFSCLKKAANRNISYANLVQYSYPPDGNLLCETLACPALEEKQMPATIKTTWEVTKWLLIELHENVSPSRRLSVVSKSSFRDCVITCVFSDNCVGIAWSRQAGECHILNVDSVTSGEIEQASDSVIAILNPSSHTRERYRCFDKEITESTESELCLREHNYEKCFCKEGYEVDKNAKTPKCVKINSSKSENYNLVVLATIVLTCAASIAAIIVIHTRRSRRNNNRFGVFGRSLRRLGRRV